MGNIYRAAKQLPKYPSLVISTSVNNNCYLRPYNCDFVLPKVSQLLFNLLRGWREYSDCMGIPCAEARRAANYFSFFRIKRHRTDQVTLSQLTSSDQAYIILAFNFLLIFLLLFLLKNSCGIYRIIIFYTFRYLEQQQFAVCPLQIIFIN